MTDSNTIENIIYYNYFSSEADLIGSIGGSIAATLVTKSGYGLLVSLVLAIREYVMGKVWQPYLDEASKNGYTNEEAFRQIIRTLMDAAGISSGVCVAIEYAYEVHISFEVRTFFRKHIICISYHVYHDPRIVRVGAQ